MMFESECNPQEQMKLYAKSAALAEGKSQDAILAGARKDA